MMIIILITIDFFLGPVMLDEFVEWLKGQRGEAMSSTDIRHS